MVPWARVHTIERTMPLLDALQRMAETGVSQLPVVASDGRPVGVLSREMIVENMRLRSQLRTGIERSAQVRQRTRDER